MRSSIAIATLLLSTALHAQTAPFIGFADTLLFNDSLRYAAFGYDGPAPLFVQAWFPMHASPKAPPLSYGQLREPSLRPELRRVHEELLLRMDSAFIAYDLRYPFDGDEPIDYAPWTEAQVKDSLYALSTKAHRVPFPRTVDRPVILNHHGSQGLSDENVWMAEHFAAHGHIFISCNFHWPMERAMYGTPLVWAPDRTSIRTLLRFAREWNGGDKVFYIGHSWGAQEGWCTLYEPDLVDAFVSLETTMEWKTDTAEVRDKWPHVLKAITTQRYPMPILMVADTEDGPPFPMFKGVRGELLQLDPKDGFGHESHTSAYLMRLELKDRIPMPDAQLMVRQRAIYQAMLDELLIFLQRRTGTTVSKGPPPDADPFLRY